MTPNISLPTVREGPNPRKRFVVLNKQQAVPGVRIGSGAADRESLSPETRRQAGTIIGLLPREVAGNFRGIRLILLRVSDRCEHGLAQLVSQACREKTPEIYSEREERAFTRPSGSALAVKSRLHHVVQQIQDLRKRLRSLQPYSSCWRTAASSAGDRSSNTATMDGLGCPPTVAKSRIAVASARSASTMS